jgi:hypothetical protein
MRLFAVEVSDFVDVHAVRTLARPFGLIEKVWKQKWLILERKYLLGWGSNISIS